MVVFPSLVLLHISKEKSRNFASVKKIDTEKTNTPAPRRFVLPEVWGSSPLLRRALTKISCLLLPERGGGERKSEVQIPVCCVLRSRREGDCGHFKSCKQSPSKYLTSYTILLMRQHRGVWPTISFVFFADQKLNIPCLDFKAPRSSNYSTYSYRS